MASQPTKSGTRKLSDIALKVVAPSGITSTAWPSVRDTCARKLAITFDPWQDGAGRLILSKRADGKLAVMIGGVGLSVPRQVGKTYLIGAIVFALCILRPGLLVIWSAHHARTHGETFLSMQALADRVKVKPHIRQVFTGSGDEEIRFGNGSRILFGARERGFGRGIPGVDVIVSDEAQIMTDKALDAQLATMNTSQFGLAIFVGTPPRPEDPSQAFTRMRSEAWAGTLKDAVWIELGATAGADPDDRKQWAKANPSFPHRTPVESMLRLRRKLTPESFLREGLGIWDKDRGVRAVVDMAQWAKLADPIATVEGQVTLAVAIPRDRSSSTVSVSWLHGERVFSAVTKLPGTSKAVELIRRKMNEHDVLDVSLHSGGPAGTLVADLEAEGVEVTTVSTQEFAQATGAYRDGIANGEVGHVDQYELTEALRVAQLRTSGDGEMWDQRDEMQDIAPVVAVTLSTQGFVKHAPTEYDVLESVH